LDSKSCPCDEAVMGLVAVPLLASEGTGDTGPKGAKDPKPVVEPDAASSALSYSLLAAAAVASWRLYSALAALAVFPMADVFMLELRPGAPEVGGVEEELV